MFTVSVAPFSVKLYFHVLLQYHDVCFNFLFRQGSILNYASDHAIKNPSQFYDDTTQHPER